jgi:hypothetical protein
VNAFECGHFEFAVSIASGRLNQARSNVTLRSARHSSWFVELQVRSFGPLSLARRRGLNDPSGISERLGESSAETRLTARDEVERSVNSDTRQTQV